jgi:hypothetical protein
MPISDYFANRDHVREEVEIRIRFNQTTALISGGTVNPTLCSSDGKNALRRQLPLSVFTITPTQKSTLESFLDDITTELRTDAGKSILVPPPPE